MTVSFADVAALDDDDDDDDDDALNNKRKQISPWQKELEDQEDQFLFALDEKSATTLETSGATQKDEITTLKMTVAALEKTIATQTDEIASLKADNARKWKQINDGRALSARISVLGQEKQAWANNDIAKQCSG